jgi:hypothetical protein
MVVEAMEVEAMAGVMAVEGITVAGVGEVVGSFQL